jgi:hypothetical protein
MHIRCPWGFSWSLGCPDLTRVLDDQGVKWGRPGSPHSSHWARTPGFGHARLRREFNTVILADGYFVLLRIGATGPINGAMIDTGNSPEQNLRRLPLPRKLPHLTLDQICGAPLKPPRAISPGFPEAQTPSRLLFPNGRGVPRPLNCGSAQTRVKIAPLSRHSCATICRGLWLESDWHRLLWWRPAVSKSVCSPKFAATAASNGTQPPSQWESSFAFAETRSLIRFVT